MEVPVTMETKCISKLLKMSLVLLFVMGCQYQENTELKEIKKEVDILKEKITNTSQELTKLHNEEFSLKFRIQGVEEQYKSTHLDISQKGFSRIDSNLGSFLIILEDVKPYANGYKLVIHIGNPYFARFEGIKMDVEWGKELPPFPPGGDVDKTKEWSKLFDVHKKSLKTKEINIVEQLAAGSWTTVEITLYPATKDELGYLNLSNMVINKIFLLTKKK